MFGHSAVPISGSRIFLHSFKHLKSPAYKPKIKNLLDIPIDASNFKKYVSKLIHNRAVARSKNPGRLAILWWA